MPLTASQQSKLRGVIGRAIKEREDASIAGEVAVFAVRHVESGKVFIGSSMSVSTELLAQRRALKEGRHKSKHLQNAWQKYGEAAFEFVVLYNTGADDLEKAEAEIILSSAATHPKFGYN